MGKKQNQWRLNLRDQEQMGKGPGHMGIQRLKKEIRFYAKGKKPLVTFKSQNDMILLILNTISSCLCSKTEHP